jgi:UDP-glucose 4-epimerase
MKKVVVTGGAGFIGSHLSLKLRDVGFDVLVIDNLSTSDEDTVNILKSHNVKFLKSDIRDLDLMIETIKSFNPDYIFHHAAYAFVEQSFLDPEKVMSINVKGTENIAIAAIESNSNIIYASSSAVYGDKPAPQRTDGEVNPGSPYAESKLLSEHVVKNVFIDSKLKSVGLRYFNVYGPRQSTSYGSVIPAWFTAARLGKPLTIFGDEKISRDFTFVKDIVNANLKLMEMIDKKIDIENIWNVGTGVSTTLFELRNEIAKISKNVYGKDVIIPKKLGPRRNGDTMELLCGDRNILKNSLTTSLNDGLEQSSEWYYKEKK